MLAAPQSRRRTDNSRPLGNERFDAFILLGGPRFYDRSSHIGRTLLLVVSSGSLHSRGPLLSSGRAAFLRRDEAAGEAVSARQA
jgi:hypothetical protein